MKKKGCCGQSHSRLNVWVLLNGSILLTIVQKVQGSHRNYHNWGWKSRWTSFTQFKLWAGNWEEYRNTSKSSTIYWRNKDSKDRLSVLPQGTTKESAESLQHGVLYWPFPVVLLQKDVFIYLTSFYWVPVIF